MFNRRYVPPLSACEQQKQHNYETIKNTELTQLTRPIPYANKPGMNDRRLTLIDFETGDQATYEGNQYRLAKARPGKGQGYILYSLDVYNQENFTDSNLTNHWSIMLPSNQHEGVFYPSDNPEIAKRQVDDLKVMSENSSKELTLLRGNSVVRGNFIFKGRNFIDHCYLDNPDDRVPIVIENSTLVDSTVTRDLLGAKSQATNDPLDFFTIRGSYLENMTVFDYSNSSSSEFGSKPQKAPVCLIDQSVLKTGSVVVSPNGLGIVNSRLNGADVGGDTLITDSHLSCSPKPRIYKSRRELLEEVYERPKPWILPAHSRIVVANSEVSDVKLETGGSNFAVVDSALRRGYPDLQKPGLPSTMRCVYQGEYFPELPISQLRERVAPYRLGANLLEPVEQARYLTTYSVNHLDKVDLTPFVLEHDLLEKPFYQELYHDVEPVNRLLHPTPEPVTTSSVNHETAIDDDLEFS